MSPLNKKTTIFSVITLLFVLTWTSVWSGAIARPSENLPKGVFGYEERVGENIIPFNWEAEAKEKGIVITVTEEGKTFVNFCAPDGATLKWRLKVQGKHDLTVERVDDTLIFHGLRFGKKYNKTVKIDERPWYQPLSFSLGKFLDSARKNTSFWIIRADKIEVIALTAEKIGEEDLFINDATVPTQKIEIRAEGIYSHFWSATYWYRKRDNLFLRYKSVHGLPGTEPTIVELVRSPTENKGS